MEGTTLRTAEAQTRGHSWSGQKGGCRVGRAGLPRTPALEALGELLKGFRTVLEQPVPHLESWRKWSPTLFYNRISQTLPKD